MYDNRAMSIHANANEHDGYWQLRITVSTLDNDGLTEEPITWRSPAKIPSVDTEVDQVWAVLITMAHMLERQGAVGRVAAGDWPGLW